MSAFDWNSAEVRGVAADDSQCTMFVGNWLFGVGRCENRSTQRVTYVCVHEHVNTMNCCDRCAKPPCEMYCNTCTDGPETHECPLRIIVEPLAVQS